MNAVLRMPLVLAFFVGLSVVAAGLAGFVLLSWADPWIGVLGLAAALACVLAAGVGWLLLRDICEDGSVEEAADTEPLPPAASGRDPRPLRVQAMPTAELPSAYIAAVRKGAAANHAAMKARGAEARH